MDKLNDRTTTMLLSIVFGLTILSGLCYMTIFIEPNVPFNPLSPNRATIMAERATALYNGSVAVAQIVATPDQSYPPTWTTTPTDTPGPTRTPTSTRTPTPTKTSTSTRTPTPTDTSTPRPPTLPPAPTSTPTPLPYFVSSHSSSNNCADVGLNGVVNGVDGLPKAGVQIEFGEVNVGGSRFTTSTDDNGRYGALLLPGSNKTAALRSHTWFAYVLENGQKASQEFRFTTDPIYITNPRHCKGLDEDEDEFLEKGCLLDPCKSDLSIQVKTINWQLKFTGN